MLIAFGSILLNIVQRQYKGNPLGIAAVVHGIEVRQHFVAETQGIAHYFLCFLFIAPGLFAAEFAIHAMQTHNRRKNTVLCPTSHHFIVFYEHNQ